MLIIRKYASACSLSLFTGLVRYLVIRAVCGQSHPPRPCEIQALASGYIVASLSINRRGKQWPPVWR